MNSFAMNSSATAWVYKYFCETLISILLGVYQEENLLGCMVILILIVSRTHRIVFDSS